MVCLRNISVDTLHKGDTEDDDDNDLFKFRFIRMLEAICRLTLDCHGGSPLPVDTFDKQIRLNDLLNHSYLTFSKYLPTFLI